MIPKCPLCDEETGGYDLVAVAEEEEPDPYPTVVEDDSATPDLDAATYETTVCVRFRACDHAFERADVKRVRDARRELRSLYEELETTRDADRVRTLRTDIYPQRERVKELWNAMTRRTEAEEENDE